MKISRNQRHQAVVLGEQEESLPVDVLGGLLADELAVLLSLWPAGAEQEQGKLGRAVPRCVWRLMRLLLQALFPFRIRSQDTQDISQAEKRLKSKLAAGGNAPTALLFQSD